MPIDPAALTNSTVFAMPPDVPVMPVPPVAILPAPAVLDVAFKKNVPPPTDELVIVIGLVVELEESEK